MGLKKAIKAGIASAYYCLYLWPFMRRGRRVVLYYHGVKDSETRSFEKQMHCLADRATVVPPSKAKSLPRGEELSVAVTFDDAFSNLKRNALPSLKAYGIPAAIFAPAGNLGKTPAWAIYEGCDDSQEPVMDSNDLRGLHGEGYEVYSHTMTHPKLTSLSDMELALELRESKKVLDEILGAPIIAISYPQGACDDRIVDFAMQFGYSLGFTIEPDIVDDATEDMRIGRTSVSPTDGLFVFMLKMNGAYQVFTRIKALRRFLARAPGYQVVEKQR